MNEIMRVPVKMPQIIQVYFTPGLAFKLKKMLDLYAIDNRQKLDGVLATHISHKLWILYYRYEFNAHNPRKEFYLCLTGRWYAFCKKFVEGKIAEHPDDSDLKQILQYVDTAKNITRKENIC